VTTNYQKGYRMERLACKDLEALGWRTVRTAGSHGPFDVIAWKRDSFLFVQIKNAQVSPKVKAEILDELRELPRLPGVRYELWERGNHAWFVSEA